MRGGFFFSDFARQAFQTFVHTPIQREDPEVVVNKGKVRGRSYRDWMRTIERQREWLAAEEKRSERVKQQLPAILSEYTTLLIEAPISYYSIEKRSKFKIK